MVGKQQESGRTQNKYGAAAQTSVRQPSRWQEVDEALADIKNTFGFIPDFVNTITNQSIPGAWVEAKNLYFNPQTALDVKSKSLISLAVAAQIPCEMMGYFEQVASLSKGATTQEQSEAILMAAITRHWSTVLNGSQIEKDSFRAEADQLMANAKKMMAEMGGKAPPEEVFLVKFANSTETYKDIEKTLGLVPRFFLTFPEEGVAGAWSQFKGLQLNPHTALSGKQKELIGLAVASQIPCDYCIYFHRSASKLNGATDRETQEAIAMAAMSRHWSAIFHGSQMDLPSFKTTADRMIEKAIPQTLQS